MVNRPSNKSSTGAASSPAARRTADPIGSLLYQYQATQRGGVLFFTNLRIVAVMVYVFRLQLRIIVQVTCRGTHWSSACPRPLGSNFRRMVGGSSPSSTAMPLFRYQFIFFRPQVHSTAPAQVQSIHPFIRRLCLSRASTCGYTK